MTTGHRIKLDKRVSIKDGKIVKKTTIFTLKRKLADDREEKAWTAKKKPPASE